MLMAWSAPVVGVPSKVRLPLIGESRNDHLHRPFASRHPLNFLPAVVREASS